MKRQQNFEAFPFNHTNQNDLKLFSLLHVLQLLPLFWDYNHDAVIVLILTAWNVIVLWTQKKEIPWVSDLFVLGSSAPMWPENTVGAPLMKAYLVT